MAIPRTVARWNKVGLNRVTRRIAPWMPGFGVVVHRGRRSGRRYRTPVNVFPTGGGYRFALTYGADTDWVKNVLAAGGCQLETRGRVVRLVEPAGAARALFSILPGFLLQRALDPALDRAGYEQAARALVAGRLQVASS